MKNWVIILAFAIAIISSCTSAFAHEAHRKNMTDAEMAEMKAGNATEQNAMEKEPSVATGNQDASVLDNTRTPANAHSSMMEHQEDRTAFSVTDFLGRLHPALVHFPIALFLVAGLAEFILFLRPDTGMEPTVRFLVYGGAAGGVAATLLGWLAAGIRMSDRSETLGLHRWTGTSIAVAAVVAAIIAYRAQPNRIMLRLIIAGIAIALIFQGYWGAEMSLGPNHMGMEG